MNYTDLSNKVTSMLTRFGTTGTLNKVSRVFDPVTGKNSTTTNTSYTVYLVDVPEKNTMVSKTHVTKDSFEITRCDKHIYMNSSVAPSVGEVMVIHGVAYSVVALNELIPANISLLFEVWLTK